MSAVAEHGTYTWTRENDQLTLKVMKDICGSRYATVEGVGLSPVD